ncbi:MAG: hypothetical protein J7L96_10670, partial [Bacteroidales bacterium]|nr:hypothetical protein [Bacteroidales bacterium]
VFCDLSNKNIKTGVSLLSSTITDALFTYPIGTNGSDFIGAIEAIDVIQRIEMQLSRGQDISQALQNLRASISPGDNPVLVFYRLKSFE